MPDAMPKVPTAWFHLRGVNSGGIQQLDGMDCDGCTLKVKVLTYAGGQFKCTNCSISAANGFLLQGAAQNTLAVLKLMGAIPGAVPKAKPVNPNTPQLYQSKTRNNEGRMDWVSLAK